VGIWSHCNIVLVGIYGRYYVFSIFRAVIVIWLLVILLFLLQRDYTSCSPACPLVSSSRYSYYLV
jgi:uncharacterized membrane protein